jgi:hypothetical protein
LRIAWQQRSMSLVTMVTLRDRVEGPESGLVSVRFEASLTISSSKDSISAAVLRQSAAVSRLAETAEVRISRDPSFSKVNSTAKLPLSRCCWKEAITLIGEGYPHSAQGPVLEAFSVASRACFMSS